MLVYFLFLLSRDLSLHTLLHFCTRGGFGLTWDGPDGIFERYQLIGWDSHETWIGIKVTFKLFISHFQKGRIHLLPISTQTNNKHTD